MPDAGDIVWVEFDPQSGREQRGRRPALVLSALAYNEKTSLAVLCPITSHVKGYPFEVALHPPQRTVGAILADHVKSVDWRARNATYEEAVSLAALDEVRTKIATLLGLRRR